MKSKNDSRNRNKEYLYCKYKLMEKNRRENKIKLKKHAGFCNVVY